MANITNRQTLVQPSLCCPWLHGESLSGIKIKERPSFEGHFVLDLLQDLWTRAGESGMQEVGRMIRISKPIQGNRPKNKVNKIKAAGE